MNEKSIEVRILDRLVWTFIFCIFMGMVGVATGHVKVEFMEGLITGCLLTMIGNLMKDLFFNDKEENKDGGSNGQNSTASN